VRLRYPRRYVAVLATAAVGLAIAFSLPTAGFGSTAAGPKVIGQGSAGCRRWAVEVVAPDRRGLCLESLVFSPGHLSLAQGIGQCSHPVAARSALVVAVLLNRKGRPQVTVVGGAFAPAVARIEVERFDGSKQWLPVRKNGVRPYHYIAIGQRGAWCVNRITTISAAGRPLWSTSWEEFFKVHRRWVQVRPATVLLKGGRLPRARSSSMNPWEERQGRLF
jgi:hypothetical protein